MPKPDPALLDPARYPFHCEVETRYRDLDSNMHLNNGVMASLLEEARVRFHRASQFGSMLAEPGLTAMVASVAIEYLGQSHFPEPLEMHVAAARIGQTSYELCHLVTQQGNVVAFGRITMVCIKHGKPCAIPEHHRETAKSWMLAA
jgi:acyl-CoA thioester hydrolase